MASFFYADIKTDELQVHGHSDNMAGQIELFDGASSNIFIIKAPASIAQSNISITLPSTVSNTNSLMMNTDGTGNMALITPSGDISMANYGQFTLNSISNTSTITSSANINLAAGKQFVLGTAGNLSYDTTNANIIMSGSNQFITQINGTQVMSSTFANNNSFINMGSVSGESGIGFKNTAGNQIQVKPNSSAAWTNMVTHLSNCGDVVLSGLSSNNALMYNSGTSSWANRNITYADLTGNATVIPFSNNSVRLCANAGASSQNSNCIAIGNLAAANGTQQSEAIAIGTNAGFAGQSTGSIAIGQSAGSTAAQQGGAIAIGQSAGSAGQGIRSIAIGAAAHLSGVQPNYSMVLNASSSTVNAEQDSSTYIAPLRNVNTSNVVMYNNSTKEITYGSRDYYTLTMWGALNNTYASSTGTLKFLFTLDATYWDTAPDASASPPSLTQFSSGAITYNTSNGIIELNSAKNYYMDLDVQMSVNYGATATVVMELVKNPVTSNTILCTSRIQTTETVDYVFFTLPMKTIIESASNIRINVYKSSAGSTATALSPDCQISMLLQEI